MIGLVVVSHSHILAEGIRALVDQIGQGKVPIATAGGVDNNTIGTNPDRILAAIQSVWSQDGVLVLMDLGSAVLGAEMALERLSPEERKCVRLSAAPLVEGAVAAAALIAAGASIDEVADEASTALQAKRHQLEPQQPTIPQAVNQDKTGATSVQIRATVRNVMGLHARPAALFVQQAGEFQATVRVRNLTRNTGWANGRSLNSITLLDAQQGHELLIEATGPQARAAVEALAALINSGFGESTVRPDEATKPPAATLPAGKARLVIAGLTGSPGIAIGPAVYFRPKRPHLRHMTSPTAPEAEMQKLEEALALSSKQLLDVAQSVRQELGPYSAAIFEVQRTILQDPDLLDRVRCSIYEQKRPAASAWEQELTALATEYRNAQSPVLRARAVDIEDLRDRVLSTLIGAPHEAAFPGRSGLLVIQELSPSLVFTLPRRKIRGICSAGGGPTSHAALLARSLNIPMLVGLGPEILTVPEGMLLAMDASAGFVAVEPDTEGLAHMEARRTQWLQRVKLERRERRLPSVTRDGRKIIVAANAANAADAHAAKMLGAEGIGLLRTEFLFLDRNHPPTEDEQLALYAAVLRASYPNEVIIRTLDVGGDKPPSYVSFPKEANPFLGLRGLRFSLAYPELFKVQLRAILRAASEGRLKIMFPMVATEEELDAALTLFESVRAEVSRELKTPVSVDVGIMLEVPSAAIMADRLARRVGFFSLGTNDMVQYLMAAERGNPAVASIYDPLHPAVLRTIHQSVHAAHEAGRWVGMCGEMAAIPEAVPLLIGLGLDELSVVPTSVPTVKAIVRRATVSEARVVAREAMVLKSGAEVRTLVRERFGHILDPFKT